MKMVKICLVQKLLKRYESNVIFSTMIINKVQDFCTFVPNKSFGQLLDISPKNFISLKTFNPDFSYIEVGFTDQNAKPLKIEDKINIALVIS